MTVLLTVPFGCWEWTPMLCFDSDDFKFVNETTEECTVTPYTRSRYDGLMLLVVHGFQRGRFGIDAGAERSILLETGDYPFSGVVLQCDGDQTIRLMAGDALPAWGPTPVVRILDPRLYPKAPADVVELNSISSVWFPSIAKYLIFILTCSAPFVLVAMLRARRRG